jgi:hypothetical protein
MTSTQALDLQDAVKRQHEARTRLLSASTNGTRSIHGQAYIDATSQLQAVIESVRGGVPLGVGPEIKA